MEMKIFPQQNSTGPASEISVHIETLVVNGFGVSNPDHLGVVVQQELQALLQERGLPLLAQSQTATPVQIPSLRAPAIRASRRMHSATAGAKIARSIQGGLDR